MFSLFGACFKYGEWNDNGIYGIVAYKVLVKVFQVVFETLTLSPYDLKNPSSQRRWFLIRSQRMCEL